MMHFLLTIFEDFLDYPYKDRMLLLAEVMICLKVFFLQVFWEF